MDLVCAATYVALVVSHPHVCVPDLEAAAELRETHLLDLHPKFCLQTFHHLRNVTASARAGRFEAQPSFPVTCSHTFLWMSTSSLLTGLVQTEPESWGMVKNLSFFSSTVAFRDNLCTDTKREKKHFIFT